MRWWWESLVRRLVLRSGRIPAPSRSTRTSSAALTANIAVKAREAPWSADITEKAQQVLLAHVRPQACSATERTHLLKVEEEQPLRLHLLEAIAASTNDADVAIWPQLAERVHTGCIPGRPITDAGVFPKRTRERARPL